MKIFSNFCNSSRLAVRRLRSVLGLCVGLLAFAAPRVSSAGVVEPQWSWINVNFDTQSRPGLIGPAGGTNMTWNESIGTAGLTKSGLLNSNGVATSVGFTCSANCMYDWGNPPLPLLTSAAFSWVNNTPSDLVISGLTPGKKYVLYVASHHPNELGGRSLFSTTNATTTSSPQLVDNGGPNGKTYRWLRGVNYARFDKIEPDATNSIKLTMTSGSDLQRSYINGFQLIEDPSANTCSYATWLAGFNFSSISSPDLTLEGDSDRDYYSNMEEFELGLSPTVGNRRAGFLTTDFWNGISGFAVGDFLASFKYFNEPDSVTLKPLSALKFNAPYSGSRSRGYITPTVTGDYTFWLSARTSANLLLSTDLSQGKYAKRKIAAIGTDLGHGAGIGWNEPNLWDRFASQQSAPVHLDAGQSYYLEMDQVSASQVESQTNLAWACNGGAREVIPDARLSTYAKTPDDFEDDCLPDAWESQYGLSVTDNGALDPARQGEAGDYDGDGLTNREEYLLGTNPANSDTDGDGVSDLTEVNTYGTSPTVANSINTTLVASPTLTSYNPGGTTGTWQMFDGGLIGDSFRGHIEWSFTVPSNGWWLIDLRGRLIGTVRSSETLSLGLAVDGRALPGQKISFLNGQPTSINGLSPWLSAGTHTLRVDVNNEIGRRIFQILALKVLAPGGFDGNSNGRPDWVDTLLAQGNTVAPFLPESFVSPIFIEGSSRCVGGTLVTANGNAVDVARGLGDQHWYSNVPLISDGSTAIKINLENKIQMYGVAWTRWNAMAGQNIIIRVGDSLKIGGWVGINDQGNSQIQVLGQNYSIAASDYVMKTFSQPGTFPVIVSRSGGIQTSANVSVVSANFGDAAPFYTDYVTRRTFENVSPLLQIVGDSSVIADQMMSESFGQSVRLRTSESGIHVLAARIPNGAIVALGTVLTLGVSDALRNDAAQYIGTANDGYSIFRTPIMVTDLPVGGRVEITVFRAGVTFMDGTTVTTLTSSDFVNGVAYLQFRFPPGVTGGYCHYMDIFDAQNRYLGRR